jgi:hypothetical protein
VYIRRREKKTSYRLEVVATIFFLSSFSRHRSFNFCSAAPTATTRVNSVEFRDRVFFFYILFYYYYIRVCNGYVSIVLITANNFTDPPDRYERTRMPRTCVQFRKCIPTPKRARNAVEEIVVGDTAKKNITKARTENRAPRKSYRATTRWSRKTCSTYWVIFKSCYFSFAYFSYAWTIRFLKFWF